MTVLLSGLHSGPNPSPGVGTARSLRAAYQKLDLLGVDYSFGSPGLHWTDLDDVWVGSLGSELDLEVCTDEISARLRAGSLWLSGLGLETIWLSSSGLNGDRLLIPPVAALQWTKKPAAGVAEALGLQAPPTLPLSAPPSELTSFGRSRGWQVWLKGPFYEAQRVGSWGHLLSVRDSMQAVWGTDDLHLQAHVAGLEESITFAAYKGELLGACSMTKSATTAEGKTWARTVREVEPILRTRICQFAVETAWTGGAEVESAAGRLRAAVAAGAEPSIPAWIHGATLAGRNLPAALVAAAMGWPTPTDSPLHAQTHVQPRRGRGPRAGRPRPAAAARASGGRVWTLGPL